MTRSLGWLACALAGVLLAQVKDSQADLTLQAAIKQETVDGDVKSAIEQYRKLAHGRDRNVAAKALVRMADCYIKLGQGDAENIYLRVLREYSDQVESTTEARKRLAVLRGSNSRDAIAKRRLWADCGESEGSISPDGRSMVLTDWCESGDLVIRDILSGHVKRLMAKPTLMKDSKIYAQSPVFSPDMKQIAFLWENDESRPFRVQLRIMTNEVRGTARTLLDKPEYTWYQPAGWSRDGKSVLTVLQGPDRTWQLAWIAVADGSVKVLKSFGWRLYNTSARPRLSPDGRYIAYNALAVNPIQLPPESKDQRIYVLASDGSAEAEVVKTAGINDNPIWTPDGKHLLFTSDRLGTMGLWSIGMRNGRAIAPPTPVLNDIGNISAMGMTDSGTYHYFLNRISVDQIGLRTWHYDRSTATTPVVVNEADLIGLRPSLSPDGKSLAFTRHQVSVKGKYDLVVHSLETGDETVYPLEGVSPGTPGWLNSGNALLVVVTNAGKKLALYSVDLRTKTHRQMVEFEPSILATGRFQIGPDDKTLYIAGRSPDNNNLVDRIHSLDITTGQRKLIFQTTTTTTQQLVFRLSPDGRTLAVRRRDPRDDMIHFSRVSIDGTDHRELYARKGRSLDVLAWTSDGRDICLRTAKQNHDGV